MPTEASDLSLKVVNSISVIIPCYNAADTIGAQLQALDAQTDAPDFEVVLVDNRSSDNTREVIDSWLRRVNFTGRVVSATDAQGVSYARNVGVGTAESDRLMFCDADDVVSEWWLAHGHKNFDRAAAWNGSAVPLGVETFNGTITAVRTALGDDPKWCPPQDPQLDSAFPILMGGNFGCERELYVELGGFDQALPTRGEDNDLAHRLVRAGHGVPTSPSTRVAVRPHAKQSLPHFARADALAHALLCSRYGIWDRSPFRSAPEEIVRAFLAGLRQVARGHGLDAGWRLRMGRTAGWAEGRLRFRWLGQTPAPQLAHGLGDAERSVFPEEA